MKVAIIGAGIAGLSCALEFERNGVYPDIYERDASVGWYWPSVIYWPNIFTNEYGDIIEHLSDKYGVSISYTMKTKSIIMKSANKTFSVKGKSLGYFLNRGKTPDSIENQLARKLQYSVIHYNSPCSYKDIAGNYDYVIIATGKTQEVKELGVWEELDISYMFGGVAVGNFDSSSSTIFFNTDYSGVGYGRITPFNSTQAVVGIYAIGMGDVKFEVDSLFERFLTMENLKQLDMIYRLQPDAFPIGRVKKVRIGNILLVGRAAGLTDRLIGVGGYDAIISGVLAARAILENKDYEEMLKPIKDRVENISAFRNVVNKFNNDDFDKMISILNLPGIKQISYKSGIDFVDMFGGIIDKFTK